MFEDKFKSYNSFFGSIVDQIKRWEKEDILALMHVAVDINDKDWFVELGEKYKLMWGTCDVTR